MDKKKARIKAEEIVSQMTVEEKISQLLYQSPAIERLGIKEYNWWNEACHGVARSGIATVFPQNIGMSATFNPDLIRRVADAISTEGRAKYNLSVKNGDREIYKGLTYWAPNINIFRDPRWGRGQETCGEDPFLSAEIGSAFIEGLQGDGEYYKATGCSKHFAVHSGPEGKRHSFSAEVSEKDLYETYLPAFEKTVKAGVGGVMGAYSGVNGTPCCANEKLIRDILRGDWGFDGYFVSDCGAIKDIYEGHRYKESPESASAAALRAGCDLNCGEAYVHLNEAYEQDMITEEEITEAAVRLYTVRALLGEFEEKRPYSDIPYSAVCSAENTGLNLQTARESLVLLENKDSFLPLDKNEKMKIAVIGPNAMSVSALEGNYCGHAEEYFTAADGIRRVFANSEIKAAQGSRIFQDKRMYWEGFNDISAEGQALAEWADVTVLCLGLDPTFEGEETGYVSDFFDCGDRKKLSLPECQEKLAEAVCGACENVIVVLFGGGGIDIGEEIRNRSKAVIHAFYPGALGGLAIAGLIAGEYSPSGKLPVTFYRADSDLPPIEDYSMKNRTYRYYEGEPLYKFGYGLSYTELRYSAPRLVSADGDTIVIKTDIENVGKFDSAEKVQCYASFTDSRTETPRFQLCGIKPVFLKAGEKRSIGIEIDRYWLCAVLPDGERVAPDGEITLYVGGGQPEKDATGIKIQ